MSDKKTLNPKHKSFVMYFDQKPMFDVLTNEEAGKLIKLILGMDKEPYPLINDAGIKVAFAQIQNRIFENDEIWTNKNKKASISIFTRWLNENERKYRSFEISKEEYLSEKTRIENEIQRIENEIQS